MFSKRCSDFGGWLNFLMIGSKNTDDSGYSCISFWSISKPFLLISPGAKTWSKSTPFIALQFLTNKLVLFIFQIIGINLEEIIIQNVADSQKDIGRYPRTIKDVIDVFLKLRHEKSVELFPCLNIRASTPHSSNKLFHAVPYTTLNNWFSMSFAIKSGR